MEGNQMKMREALVDVKKSIDGIGKSSLDCDPTILMDALTQVCARLSARIELALSAPPRNCDVGTAEEQEKRFYEKFCVKSCLTCPLSGLKRSRKADCIMTWAQMPYEAQEGGAKA